MIKDPEGGYGNFPGSCGGGLFRTQREGGRVNLKKIENPRHKKSSFPKKHRINLKHIVRYYARIVKIHKNIKLKLTILSLIHI